MKFAIGHRIQQGPWGGGNRFAMALVEELRARGQEVVFDLSADDIDLILMTDPRVRNPAVTFTPGAILRYLALDNSQAIVVHRVNECDERKNTRSMNGKLCRANYVADHTVFVGSWLRELPAWRDHPPINSSVILNGSDAVQFNARGYRSWTVGEPLQVVTHHWGGNWMKGFDVYQKLDRMMATPEWRDRIAFTYIGNLPPDFGFVNARHVQPLTGADLVAALRGHHVYVTASINEPGGHHQNEGALCGLPLIYRNSGCMPEYCKGFGIMFEGDDVEPALQRMMADYAHYAIRMNDYPHTADRMCAAYIDLFERLIARRDEIVTRRRLWRDPYLVLRNQLAV